MHRQTGAICAVGVCSETADSSEDFWAKDESQLKLDPPPAPPADFKPDEPDYDAFQGVKFSE